MEATKPEPAFKFNSDPYNGPYREDGTLLSDEIGFKTGGESITGWRRRRAWRLVWRNTGDQWHRREDCDGW